MTGGPKFCLRWDGFRSRLSSVFDELRRDGELLDVTLCCDGGHMVQAHRILLSASSPCLRQLLKEHPCQHPVFFLKDTSSEDLRAIIEFVYNGEVNVSQTQLASFIKTAELLQIRGLSGDSETEGEQTLPKTGQHQGPATASTPPPPPVPPPPVQLPVVPPPVQPPLHSVSSPARLTSRAADTAGLPPTKRPRLSSAGAAASGGTVSAAAAAAATTASAIASAAASAATAAAAASTSSVSAAAAGLTGVIKTEQVDLTEDEGAALEETLARLSSFEDHDSTGASSQHALDASAADLPGFPTLDVSEDVLAGSTSGAATGRDTSLSERGSTWIQSDNSQTGLHSQDLFAVLDCKRESERAVLILRNDQRMPTDESSDLEDIDLQSDDEPLRPRLTMDQILRPELDVNCLSAHILRKLIKRTPLQPSDWRELMQCIHHYYQPYDQHIRQSRIWYPTMAESIIEQFPFVLPQMSRQEALMAVTGRLKNKFKNKRRRQSVPLQLAISGTPGASEAYDLSSQAATGQNSDGNMDAGQASEANIGSELNKDGNTPAEQNNDMNAGVEHNDSENIATASDCAPPLQELAAPAPPEGSN